MKSKTRYKRILTLLFSFMLAAGYVIPAAQPEAFAYAGDLSEEAAVQETEWYDSIPDLLAAGKYEKGVVIAGIDMSKAKKTGNPGSALDSNKLKSGTEEIISIDADTIASQEFSSWFQQLKDSMSGQQDDGICITSIRRDDMTTEQILKLLASDDSVVFAEPNYIIDMEAEEDEAAADDPDPVNAEALNDEEISSAKAGGTDVNGIQFQWSSNEDSSFHAAGKSGDVSIKVPGWPDGSNMDHEIIAAVMDMPVDFSHPDLEDRAYTFSDELKEKLECDDHGYNALWDAKGKELEYTEGAEHGTHVAGIIGASWNGKGINGVGSNVKIVSVQNCYNRYTSLIDTLRGYSFIKNAVKEGVNIRIVNNSWRLEQSSKALDAAVTEVGEQGVISIFAAGNESADLNTVPDITSLLANNPYTVKVASTTPAGELADSSCYGKGIVDLGAPGACILSCIPICDAAYLPCLAENNKFYETFEDAEPGSSDNVSVKVSQVGFDVVPNEWGGTDDVVNPDKVISGTEGIVVSGNEDMGFEGKNVLKVRIDRSQLDEGTNDHAALKIELGNISDLGVKEGDMLTFMYGADQELEPISVTCGSNYQVVLYEKNNRNCWKPFTYTFEGGEDTDHLTLIMTFVTNGAEEIYLDTFGIGDESQKQPYAFLSGTSMAAPAVSGSAAVLASRHFSELEEMSSSSAIKLADLIRSSVRPLAALKDMTSTGGIIDLTVDTELSDPDADQPGPDIRDLTVSGNKVTLTGSDFGSAPGTAKVSKHVIGDPSDIDASVTSWNDSEVVLTLGEDFKGIIEVALTKADGKKKDTIIKYISKSDNIFENDLTLLSGTGDPLIIDEEDPSQLGDYETSGLLAAGDDDLYYLPQIAKVELNPAYRTMFCYHPATDSWEKCPGLPEWIKEASCSWLNGKLYVKGTSVDVDDSGTIPYYEREDNVGSGEPCVFSYDTLAQTWERCSNKGVAAEYALFSDGNKLMMAGVSDEEYNNNFEAYPNVRDYDPEAGAGGHEIFLDYPIIKPKAAFAGGYIYLLDFEYFTTLNVIDRSKPKKAPVEIDLPEFYFGAAPERSTSDDNRAQEGDVVMLSYDDTLILTGPAAENGSSDTFTLKAGKTNFKPFSKRASDAEVILPSAAMLDGRLYVIGSSDFEPDNRVFRSAYVPVNIEDAKVILSSAAYTYNGKVHKPSIKTVKGLTLKEGTDYTAKWSNAKSKNVGSYTVTITGKGKYTGKTTATYKIRPKGTSIKKLYKGKKSIWVRWNRQHAKMSKSRITGYQIQLATDKKFTKNKRTIRIKGYKKFSKKVTKLKAKKKYYVRVRTYKTVKGVRYYSKWSKARTVKTR